jgi:hypothetical protein
MKTRKMNWTARMAMLLLHQYPHPFGQSGAGATPDVNGTLAGVCDGQITFAPSCCRAKAEGGLPDGPESMLRYRLKQSVNLGLWPH